uniref:Uncharacterized protein n=1 Tax=Geladintestivirus 6 TaxID=3233138 RepID=A0AAU8MIY5_9CAUD
MIALLSCSTNLYANDYHSFSTGEVVQEDSVLISYDDLKVVNGKLIELKYEKETNNILRTIIRNDSLIIDTLTISNTRLTSDIQLLNESNKKYKKQRNVGFSIGIIGVMVAILMLIK